MDNSNINNDNKATNESKALDSQASDGKATDSNATESQATDGQEMQFAPIEGKRTVLDADDIMEMVPKLKGHRRLVECFIHFIGLDKVNWIHEHNAGTPGPLFTTGLLA